jgi:hypothetical protein
MTSSFTSACRAELLRRGSWRKVHGTEITKYPGSRERAGDVAMINILRGFSGVAIAAALAALMLAADGWIYGLLANA